MSSPPLPAAPASAEAAANPNDAPHEGFPAAPAVADRAGHEVQRREGKRVREKHPLLTVEAKSEVLLERGQGYEDDGRVDERERGAENRGEQGHPSSPQRARRAQVPGCQGSFHRSAASRRA